MKFQFKIQQYQTEAVEAVVKVFEGQPFNDRLVYLRDLGKQSSPVQQTVDNYGEEYLNGFGNAPIELTDDNLLDNIHSVQADYNINQSSSLSKPFGAGCRLALDIEMETGTGKTYCYIKTMFELNKKYGWSKFIVVVPSIAIREGVKKSFEVMEDHFFEQYGKKARYFIYNSKNLNQLDDFSANKDIYVMIINSQAFASSLKEGAKNEAARIIYSKQDSFGSRCPIDVIAANRPIIILDEPQKLGGDATQNGIKQFKPLFTINYSATHKDVHNLVYVLDALDAYKKKLVKKIEVKGFEIHNLRGTDGFLYLSEILVDPKKPPRARIAMEINHSNGVKRESRIVNVEDDLYVMSGNGKTCPYLEQYRDGFVVKDINAADNTVTFLNGETLSVGETTGDINERDIRRIQIRETILSHFEKEKKLFNQGIKCLSLFFIDEVANYRQYDENGNELLGEYGKIFEEEYIDVLNEYIRLDETPYIKYLKNIEVRDTHKGYFSIDKKTNRAVNSVEKKGVCDDISAYDLILKNKERLLSFDEPTRFIFSHSALREGWDNPNVFQICTLKQSNSEVNKRQEVGRGMRLCVNQSGDRMDEKALGREVQNVNVLTVVASDSYKSFVSDLQNELKSNLYARPTKAIPEYFTGKVIKTAEGPHTLSNADGREIYYYLRLNEYIQKDGTVTDAYRQAQSMGIFAELPAELAPYEEGIHKLVQGIYDEKALAEILNDMVNLKKPTIKDNSLNKNFYKKEFQALWDKINHIYTYTASFDSEELIKKAIEELDKKMFVTPLMYTSTVGSQTDTLDFGEGKSKTSQVNRVSTSDIKYDLIGKICEGTRLTRKTVAEILKGIKLKTFEKFNGKERNPEEFILKAIQIINGAKADIVVEAITYNMTEREQGVEIFTLKSPVELNRIYEAERCVTPYVICDSDIERSFAKELDSHTGEVCVYAKLPSGDNGFKIPTPVGDYSPDWAIAFKEGTVKYIYFIAETKGKSNGEFRLDNLEKAKTECARKLFEKLNGGAVHYDVISTYQDLLNVMSR